MLEVMLQSADNSSSGQRHIFILNFLKTRIICDFLLCFLLVFITHNC